MRSQVLHAFLPTGDDKANQLPLSAGEIVTVIHKDDSGWWAGHKDGEHIAGWFPSRVVKPLSASDVPREVENQGDQASAGRLDGPRCSTMQGVLACFTGNADAANLSAESTAAIPASAIAPFPQVGWSSSSTGPRLNSPRGLADEVQKQLAAPGNACHGQTCVPGQAAAAALTTRNGRKIATPCLSRMRTAASPKDGSKVSSSSSASGGHRHTVLSIQASDDSIKDTSSVVSQGSRRATPTAVAKDSPRSISMMTRGAAQSAQQPPRQGRDGTQLRATSPRDPPDPHRSARSSDTSSGQRLRDGRRASSQLNQRDHRKGAASPGSCSDRQVVASASAREVGRRGTLAVGAHRAGASPCTVREPPKLGSPALGREGRRTLTLDQRQPPLQEALRELQASWANSQRLESELQASCEQCNQAVEQHQRLQEEIQSIRQDCGTATEWCSQWHGQRQQQQQQFEQVSQRQHQIEEELCWLRQRHTETELGQELRQLREDFQRLREETDQKECRLRLLESINRVVAFDPDVPEAIQPCVRKIVAAFEQRNGATAQSPPGSTRAMGTSTLNCSRSSVVSSTRRISNAQVVGGAWEY